MVGWNKVINQKLKADMESICTLQMAKVLFNSDDDPPTEQYLHSDYDYISDRVCIQEVSPMFQENIDYSSFIGNMTYVESVGDFKKETKE